MVTLIQPKSDKRYYIWESGALFGPFDNNSVTEYDRFELPLPDDSFAQNRGIYHENFVDHVKTEGTVMYHPDHYLSIPQPSTNYPDRLLVPWGSGTNQITVDAGFAIENKVSYREAVGVIRQALYKGTTSEGWVWYTIISQRGSSKLISEVYRSCIKPLYISGIYWKCRIQVEHAVCSPKYTSSWDWTNRADPELYLDQWAKAYNAGKRDYSEGNYNYQYGYVRRTSSVDMSVIHDALVCASRNLDLNGWKLDEKHYGDLAMEASEKVNATRINAIAFLKDLRDPTSMIPKLRNLGSLKTMANNYLTIKYGILPTISDVQNIVAAFERMKPFLDRNGFTVHTAGHCASETDRNITRSVEQHIKLAIGHEDNEFEELLERLESMGTLPTFENLWDLVPYSFVIDWLVDVGGFLERIDTHLRLIRLNIKYVTMSRKLTVQQSGWIDEKHALFGYLTRVQYRRWVSDLCPVPPLSLQPTLTGFNHWLESSALLIQRTKLRP